MPPRRLSREAFEEISELVAPARQTDGDRRREEKMRLSEERMKRWPDTIQAQRKKKEDAYLDRLRKQEERRVELDKEEDERRARERKEKIEYATKTIYRNTDKIKRLSSAELLSDCLHTREAQIALAKRVESAEKEWNEAFLAQERETLKRLEAREIAETEERKRVAKEVSRVQQEQLAEVRARYEAELQEQEEEGRRMLERAREMQREATAKQEQKQEQGRLNQLAVLEANEELKRIKSKLQEREEEEKLKIEEYARQKEDLKARQAAQFKKIEGAKQRRREEMIEQGVRRLRELNQQNSERLENEIAEARRVEDERLRILSEKRAEFARSIDSSRRTQVQMRELEKQRQHEKEQEQAIRWREYNQGAEELERLEDEAERRAARQHAQILLNQAQEKRERLLDERREEIFQARSLADQEQVNLDDFRKVALERIAVVEAAGKNPYPLKKCLNDVMAGR